MGTPPGGNAEHWSDRDLLELDRLVRRYVDDLLAAYEAAKESSGHLD